MSGVTEQQVLAALKNITDPEKGQDIVALGMVSGVTVREGHVAFAIEVDAQRGPRMEPLRKAAEKAVDALPGVLSVTAVLTAQAASRNPAPRPTHVASAGQPHDHSHAPAGGAPVKPGIPGVRAIVAVASGKGGVGKSTTAVNLAMGMVACGLKVGLLDADIYGPSIPRMLGITGKPASHDGKHLQPMSRWGVVCMSMGFLVPEDTPMIWRGPMVMSALQQMLRDVAWGELDILLVDLPPGTGDAQLTMAQQVPLAGAVIVSTPQDIALLDARKGLNMFRKVDVPVLGIIENMSYFNCPNCGHRSEIFSHGGAHKEADKLGMEFLGEIPLDIAIRETSDEGKPITATQPGSQHAELYRKIAARVWEKLGSGDGGLRPAPRILVQ